MRKMRVYIMGDNEAFQERIKAYCEKTEKIEFVSPHSLLQLHLVTDKAFLTWRNELLYHSDMVLWNFDAIDDTLYEFGVLCGIDSFSDHHLYIVGTGGKEIQPSAYMLDKLFHYEENLTDAIDFLETLCL